MVIKQQHDATPWNVIREGEGSFTAPMDESTYQSLRVNKYATNKFHLDFDYQDDNTPESKAEDDVVNISLNPDKLERKAKID